MMPDEFKLRPHSTDDACSNRYRRKLAMMNDEYEQGARALAAAMLEALDAQDRSLQKYHRYAEATGITWCMDLIHRLVPPGAGKEKA